MHTGKPLSLELLRRRYRRAERAIKRSALISGAVPTPAVNQLRYVGCHIFAAIQARDARDSAKEQYHLQEADSHCDRAWFDAFDCIACHHLDVIKKFEEKRYPVRIIEKHVGNYVERMAQAREIYKTYRLPECVQGMTVRQRLDRMVALRKVAAFFRELAKVDRAFHDAMMDIERKRNRNEFIARIVSSITSSVGSVFGILLSALGLAIIDKVQHPTVVLIGKIGIGTFVVLLVVNLVVLVGSLVRRWWGDRTHPPWD